MTQQYGSSNIIFGNKGEDLVVEYLEKNNFKILERNFYIQRKIGEIDIIAKKSDLIVFVEVKRRSSTYTKISDIITAKKRSCIIKTAELYLLKNNINTNQFILRFDIAYIITDLKEKTNNIEYFENVFTKI